MPEHRWEVVFWSKGNLLVATPLAKMTLFSEQWLTANIWRRDGASWAPSLILDEILCRLHLQWVLDYKGYVLSRWHLFAEHLSLVLIFFPLPLIWCSLSFWVSDTAILPRVEHPTATYPQHFDWLKVCAKYCLLKWQRQCTTPILNDELGLGSRVTLFWKPFICHT